MKNKNLLKAMILPIGRAMKKARSLLLLCTLLLMNAHAWASSSVTYTLGNGAAVASVSTSDVVLTENISSKSGSNGWTIGNTQRITISAASGYKITALSATFSRRGDDKFTFTVTGSTTSALSSGTSASWSGDATQLVFTGTTTSSPDRLTELVVTYESGSSARTFKSGEKVYFKDASGNISWGELGCLWVVSNGNVYAHFWNDTESATSSWGTAVSGSKNSANTIYEITVPGSGKEYTHVIFTRGDESNKFWNQTQTQTPNLGYNMFCISNDGYYSDSQSPKKQWKGSWDRYAPGSAVLGDFNNWDPDKGKLTDGRVIIELAASKAYGFKVLMGDGTSLDNWYGLNTGNITNTNVPWWTLKAKENNCTVTSGESGEYCFHWNSSTKAIGIYYPQARLTANEYIYFDARNNSSWKADDFDAKFYFKYYDSDDNHSNKDCSKANAQDSWVYYTTVPDNVYIGHVQMNKYVGGDYSATADDLFARDRSSSDQNCILLNSSNNSVSWSTYCPPMSSATLSDNSTAKVSWQTGTGTSGAPYLVAASGTIKVSALATSAVPDENMEAKYDFKVNDNNGGASSAQSSTSNTYDKTSLTTGHTYEISLDAWNNYNSTDGTKNTSATHLWYKAVTLRDVEHTLSHVTCTGGRAAGTGQAADGEAFSTTFTAATGYNLPATVTVKFGSTTKSSGTDYTWNSSTGVLTINAATYGNTIKITVTGVAKTTTLTFNANTSNHGSGDNGGATATYDASSLSSITHTSAATGYTREGYYTTASVGGVKVLNANGALVRNVTGYTSDETTPVWKFDGATETLYARYTINSHTLTWNFDGGSSNETAGEDYTAGGTKDYGTSITYPSDGSMSKTGHTFSSWSSDATTMPDNDLTITAQWSVNTYDVTHSFTGVTRSSGGTGGTNAATYGTNYTVTVSPDDGYSLPSTISVTIDGAATTYYTWNSSTGAVVVDGDYILGDIEITIEGEEDDCGITLTQFGTQYKSGSNPRYLYAYTSNSFDEKFIIEADDSYTKGQTNSKTDSLYLLVKNGKFAKIHASSSLRDSTFDDITKIKFDYRISQSGKSKTLTLDVFVGAVKVGSVSQAVTDQTWYTKTIDLSASPKDGRVYIKNTAGSSDQSVHLNNINICGTLPTPCTEITPTWSTDYTSTTLNVGGTSSTPVVDKDDSSGTLSFRTSDSKIATINSSGVVTAVGAGSVTITATVAEDETNNYCEGSVTETFTIKAGVTYNANGADDGEVPTDANYYAANADITIKGNTGSLVKTDKVFNGWNTKADGTGTHYEVGATMKMPSKSTGVTLYAEWVGYATSWDWWKSGQSNNSTNFTYLTNKNYSLSFASSASTSVASWDMSGDIQYRGVKIKTKDHNMSFWVQTGKRVSITFGYMKTKPTFTVGGVNKSGDLSNDKTGEGDSTTVTYTTSADTKFYIENEATTGTALTIKSINIEDNCTAIPTPRVDYSTTNIFAYGGTPSVAYVVSITNPGNGTVTYSSSNTDVATVDSETGLVTAVGPGTTTITAAVGAGGEYCGTNITKTITVQALVTQTINVGNGSGDGVAWGTPPDMTFDNSTIAILSMRKVANISNTGYTFNTSTASKENRDGRYMTALFTGVPSETSKDDDKYLSLQFKNEYYRVRIDNVVLPIQPKSNTVSAIATISDGTTTYTSAEVADITAGAIRDAKFTFTPAPIFDANKTITVKFFVYDQSDDKGFRLASPILVDGSILLPKQFKGTGNWDVASNWQNYDMPETYHDVDVWNGATLTITGNKTAHDLKVKSGGTLNVSTNSGTGITLTLNQLNLEGGFTTSATYDMPRVYIDSKSSILRTNPTINFDISVNHRNYYPIALPFDVALNSVDYARSDLASISIYGTHYKIAEYNGQKRANNGGGAGNWDDVESGSTLKAGRGYILSAITDGGEAVIRFPMNMPNGWTTSGEQGTYDDVTKNEVAVYAYTNQNGDTQKANKGWNLLGVPYMSCFVSSEMDADPSDAYLKGLLTIWSGEYKDGNNNIYVTIPKYDFTEYDQLNITEAVLLPGWCFFVQMDKDATLAFDKDGERANAPFRATMSEQVKPTLKTGIILTGNGAKDKTNFLISDKYSAADYEINADLEKMFGENSFTLATYSLSGETRLAYNALSNADAANIIPIGYRAPADGEYTFSINPRYAENGAFEHVNLIDYETGIMTDLLMGSYTFSTERTQLDTRFALNVVPRKETPTDIETVGGEGFNDANAPRKVLINDKMYIIIDGKMYDATGKAVK